MKKLFIFSIVIFGFVAQTGCTWWFGFQHYNTVTPEHYSDKKASLPIANRIATVDLSRSIMRTLPRFDQVDVIGPMDVKIYPSNTRKLKLTGPTKFLNQVSVQVKNGRLELLLNPQFKNHLEKSGMKRIKVELGIPTVTLLRHVGTGFVQITGLQTHTFNVVQNGSGPIRVSGYRIPLHKVYNYSSGDITISNIISNNVEIIDRGRGNIKLKGQIGLRKLTTGGHGSVTVNGVVPTPAQIVVSGSGNVTLTGSVNAQDIYHSGSGNLVINKIKTNALTIEESGSGNLDIYGSANLSQLAYLGSGNINIHKVYSPNFSMISEGSGQVNISGDIHLRSLDYMGEANINMLWVDSDTIRIKARGCGKINLAGIAKEMHANIKESVTLNAHYLRVDETYVKTYNHAFAKVWTKDALFARATEDSNIYYYNEHGFKTKYLASKAGILPMYF